MAAAALLMSGLMASAPSAQAQSVATQPGAGTPQAPASTPSAAVNPGTPATPATLDPVETYLQSRRINSLLLEHLTLKHAQATGPEKARYAERLARLLVEQLAKTSDIDERQRLTERARALLGSLDGKATGLRVELLRTGYLRAEQDAEQLRLGAGVEANRPGLVKSFSTLFDQLAALGDEASRRIRQLEDRLDSGKSTLQDEEDVLELRSVRSRAYYFAGWSGVYAAELELWNTSDALPTGQAERLSTALKCFGWHTGRAAFERPSFDRLPKSMLVHEHVARACLGVATGLSLLGQDAEALRWMDAMAAEPGLAPGARAALPLRRIGVLLRAARYSDAVGVLQAMRAGPAAFGTAPTPAEVSGTARLEVGPARQIAASALRLLGDSSTTDATGSLRKVAELALSDLIDAGRTADVLALAERFGTAALGQTGFVAVYVRGTLLLERTLSEVRASRGGVLGDEAVADPAVKNTLQEAAALLIGALSQPDAAKFPLDGARAALGAARAKYFIGDDQAASENADKAFSKADAINAAVAEEALWLSVLALERIAGRDGAGLIAQEKLSSAISLFVRRFPGTAHTATLIVRRADKTGLSDEKAVEALLAVEPSSPLYAESQRSASRLLYRLFRDNRSDQRQFLARRFLAVADGVFEQDRRAALAPGIAPEADKRAESALLLCRQMLDAVLALEVPDLVKADRLLGQAEGILAGSRIPSARFGQELRFRKLQLQLGRADFAGAEQTMLQLEGGGAEQGDARFTDAARRLLFANAAARFKALSGAKQPDTAQVTAEADRIVKYGSTLLDAVGSSSKSLSDSSVLVLHLDVAAAAEALFNANGSEKHRDLAIKLDKIILEIRPGEVQSLIRLATLSERAGDTATALASWRDLSAAAQPPSAAWFMARFNAIRLTAQSDPNAASVLLHQHVLLNPTYGPSPWGQKLKELEATLPKPPQPQPASSSASGGIGSPVNGGSTGGGK